MSYYVFGKVNEDGSLRMFVSMNIEPDPVLKDTLRNAFVKAIRNYQNKEPDAQWAVLISAKGMGNLAEYEVQRAFTQCQDKVHGLLSDLQT